MFSWTDHGREILNTIEEVVRAALRRAGIQDRTISADVLRGVIDSSVVLPPHAAQHESGGADEMDLGAMAGVVLANHGGTGHTTYTIGDMLYASATSALSKLAGVATGNALISGGVGTAPAWGKIGLTTHISGVLGKANGGTGVNNAGSLTVGADTSITGGGTLALGGFTATIPATGTVALGTGAANRMAYWTGANTLDDHANLQFDPSATPTALSLLGLVKFGNVDAYYTGADNALIYGSLNTGGAFPFLTSGSLILQARASAGRAVVVVTGATPTPRLVVLEGGAVLIGATTGLTGAGDLDVTGRARADTFETSAGNKWKLLGFTAAADAASNGYVQVTIDGVTYKLSTRA